MQIGKRKKQKEKKKKDGTRKKMFPDMLWRLLSSTALRGH